MAPDDTGNLHFFPGCGPSPLETAVTTSQDSSGRAFELGLRNSMLRRENDALRSQIKYLGIYALLVTGSVAGLVYGYLELREEVSALYETTHQMNK